MNRNIKKCWILIALALLLTITGCGTAQPVMTAAAVNAATPEPVTETENTDITEEPSYFVTGYTEVSYQNGDRYEFQCAVPDGYYATRQEVTGTYIGTDGGTEKVVSTCLYYIEKTGKIRQLKNFEPLTFETEYDEVFSIEGFCADDAGNLAVLEEEFRCWSEAPEGTVKYSEPWYAQYVQVEQYYIRRLDEKGGEISRAYLHDPTGTGYIYLHDPVLLDGEHFLVVCDGVGVCAYDMDGNIQYVIPLSGTVESLTVMGSEKVAALVRTDGEKHLVLLNAGTKKQENECSLPDTAYGIACGTGDYDFYYTDSGSFYGGTFDGTFAEVLRWIDCAVDSGFIEDCRIEGDGTIVCLSDEWSEKFRDSMTGITTLKQMTASEAGITDVTLGTLDSNRSLNNLIMDYNRAGTGSRIILRDYSQYGEKGTARLRSDLMDVASPDLLDLSGMDTEELMKAGLLEDLLPYLKNDGITLVSSAEKAAENDGALYVAIQEFRANVTLNAQPVNGTEKDMVPLSVTAKTGDHLLRITALADGKTELDGYTFTLDETEATVSTAAVSLAMCSAAGNKDAAWQFLRNYFTEEYQSVSLEAFPTNQALFEELLKELQKPVKNDEPETPAATDDAVSEGSDNNATVTEGVDENTQPVYTVTCETTTIAVMPLTEEQAELWRELLETAEPEEEESEKETTGTEAPNEAETKRQETIEHLTGLVYEIMNNSTDQ